VAESGLDRELPVFRLRILPEKLTDALISRSADPPIS